MLLSNRHGNDVIKADLTFLTRDNCLEEIIEIDVFFALVLCFLCTSQLLNFFFAEEAHPKRPSFVFDYFQSNDEGEEVKGSLGKLGFYDLYNIRIECYYLYFCKIETIWIPDIISANKDHRKILERYEKDYKIALPLDSPKIQQLLHRSRIKFRVKFIRERICYRVVKFKPSKSTCAKGKRDFFSIDKSLQNFFLSLRVFSPLSLLNRVADIFFLNKLQCSKYLGG